MIWKGWSNFHLGQLIFVADNWYLSFVEGQKSTFCPKKCAKHRWGELFGDFFGWMFSPLPSITADERFIHLSVRWPPMQKARSKPTKPLWFSQNDHNSTIWGWMTVANVMGNFPFFREELAGSIPWGCILGEQWSCSARSMEIERNWPDPMEENRPENWEVSFMPSFFFDEFGLWLSAKSWKRSTTKMQLLGPTPKEVWGSTIWRFSNNWMIGIVQMVTNFE